MRRSSEPYLIAIDASALVELILGTELGQRMAPLAARAHVLAPDVINLETLQAVRGLERAGKLTAERAATAVGRLLCSPVVRVPTLGLARDAWALRFSVSAYDACYVALARRLNCPLLTVDAPLRRAPGLGVTFLSLS